MDSYIAMFFETIVGISALFALTKLLGKTQISQLTAFDFISAIILGELLGNALFDKEAGITEILFVVILWGIILYSIELITQKFNGSRFLLEGKPSFLIYQGELIYEELRKNRLDINELQQLLRLKDTFAIDEVLYAILETNGELSILKKDKYQTPLKEDFNFVPSTPKIATTLILDGEIIYDNLEEVDLTADWLLAEIKLQNYESVKEIFYAEYKVGEKILLFPYRKIKHKDYLRKFT